MGVASRAMQRLRRVRKRRAECMPPTVEMAAADIEVAAPAVTVNPAGINVTANKGDKGDTGPSWKRYAGLVVTANDGTFTVTFPAGRFSEAPIMDFQAVRLNSGDGREYSVTIYTCTATECTGRVRRSRTLPAVIGVLTALISYDPWEAPGAPVTLHAKADAAG